MSANIKLCINCNQCFKKDFSQLYWCKKTEQLDLVTGEKLYTTCHDERNTSHDFNCGYIGKFYDDNPF